MSERREGESDRHARWLETRREVEGIIGRLDERIRLADEREARRQARLRRLSVGLLGRS